jgi:plastocyanin
MRVRWLAMMGAAGAAAVLLVGVASCFSDRTTAAVEEGECRFPIGEGVPGSTIVVIRGFAFEPADVQVGPGERVTWINCDEVSHTSTADGGAWDSPLLAQGDAFTQVFETAGEFSYHCTPHPFMTGRVLVE